MVTKIEKAQITQRYSNTDNDANDNEVTTATPTRVTTKYRVSSSNLVDNRAINYRQQLNRISTSSSIYIQKPVSPPAQSVSHPVKSANLV